LGYSVVSKGVPGVLRGLAGALTGKARHSHQMRNAAFAIIERRV